MTAGFGAMRGADEAIAEQAMAQSIMVPSNGASGARGASSQGDMPLIVISCGIAMAA